MAGSTAGAGVLYSGVLRGRGSGNGNCRIFANCRLSGIRTGRKGGINYADTKGGNEGG